MSYDVFIVAALEDRDMAKLVTRRLRSLKMRVWYDAKSTDDEFDEKEARAIHRSKAVLVLWSENAVKSDFVRAAAGTGYSIKEQPFIQAALDDVVPYEPYSTDTRHGLKGFTSRTNTEGWFEIVEKLEAQQGRKDLREWLLIPTKDKDELDAWRDKHPKDPLSIKGQPVGVKKPEPETKSQAGAAALTGAAAATASAATLAARTPTSPPAPAPVSRPDPEVKVSPAKAVDTPKPTQKAAAAADADMGRGGMITMMLLAIAALFLLAYLWRTLQVQRSTLPAVANSVVYQSCPAGTVPRSLLSEELLEPGPIVNDTED